jgi:hypothetical protein
MIIYLYKKEFHREFHDDWSIFTLDFFGYKKNILNMTKEQFTKNQHKNAERLILMGNLSKAMKKLNSQFESHNCKDNEEKKKKMKNGK